MRQKARKRVDSIKRERAAKPMRCGHHQDLRYGPGKCHGCDRDKAAADALTFELQMTAMRQSPPDRLFITEVSSDKVHSFSVGPARRPGRRRL